uniref:uncharacterized protein LOC103795903 n=1 Tax=Callithrix jacchus TaxID=9483 RepID=UPI0023DD43DD|nr:uncharacterized protein LOC103795903 [Callithrix jacchus]
MPGLSSPWLPMCSVATPWRPRAASLSCSECASYIISRARSVPLMRFAPQMKKAKMRNLQTTPLFQRLAKADTEVGRSSDFPKDSPAAYQSLAQSPVPRDPTSFSSTFPTWLCFARVVPTGCAHSLSQAQSSPLSPDSLRSPSLTQCMCVGVPSGDWELECVRAGHGGSRAGAISPWQKRSDPAPLPHSHGGAGCACGAQCQGLHWGGNGQELPSSQDDVCSGHRRRGRVASGSLVATLQSLGFLW